MRAILPAIDNPVVNSSDAVPDNEASRERVHKTDQATGEAYLVSDKELPEQAKMRTDHLATLENQPIGGDKDSQPRNDSGNQTLNRGVESQKARQHYLFQNVFFISHGRVGLG